ncbi:MAG: MutS-related protein [bacterium]
MTAPKPAEPRQRPKPPAASPLFAQLPKAAEIQPAEESAGEAEEEEETPEPTLKGGLGLDLSAMAEKRRLEKEARRLARPIFQPPETRRPEKTRLAEATTEIARRKVTPIDIHLGFDFRLMIVTGPNTGGKTVALKTLGLICLMAQCGLFIPAAEGSQVQLLDNILADIGDEQSLQQSLSTFSSHMKRMTAILQSAGQRTLVLLDEMGAGTDPAEGAALGRSIVDELDNIGCLAVVTTHLGEMKSIAFGNSRVRNANVEFDLESLRPLYHLRIGEAGKSHALAIARRLQLPEHVVDRAEDFINAAGGTSLKEMEDVQKLRLEAEKARQEALTAQAEAQRLKTELEKALEEQRTRDLSNEKLKQARERIKVGDRVVVPRLGYDRPGRIAKIDLKKRAVSVSIGHMKWDAQLDELLPIDDIGPPVSPKPQYKEPRG